MKGLLIVLSLAAVALARPDIGLTLRGNTPSAGYIPSDQGTFTSYGDSAGHGSSGHNQFQSQSFGSLTGSGGGNSGFGGGNSGFGGGNSGFGGGNSGFGGANSGFGAGNSGFGGGNSGFGGGNNGFSSTSFSSVGSSGGHQGGHAGVQVTKNAYFFEGPDDEPAPQIRIHSEQAAAHHNYNLIFVKAPTYKAPIIPQIDAQSLRNEEKTRVYVLVKKQDAVQDIVIPAAGGSHPTKPEVFYIKYKTQKEAEEQIRGIQQGGNGGINAHDVGSDGAFVSTITDTKENVGSSSFQTGSYADGGNAAGLSSIGGNDGFSGGSGSSQQTVQTSQTSTNFGTPSLSGPYY